MQHTGSQAIIEDFSLIIPTLGRSTLAKCLQALLSGTRWPKHVIVIDQGSNAAVAVWLHDLSRQGILTSHIKMSKKGVSLARNRGIEQVQTTFVVAIDDDCLVESDWLENMEKHLRQNPAALITGRVTPIGNAFVPSCVTYDNYRVYKRPKIRGDNPPASGNMGFALHIAQNIGPFDERLNAAEDNDWGYRALRAGIAIIYVPEIVVYHLDWRDRSQLSATYQTYVRSTGIWYGMYIRKGDWFMVLRSILYLYRGLRSVIYGMIFNDYERRVDGFARITRLAPGLINGLRGKNC